VIRFMPTDYDKIIQDLVDYWSALDELTHPNPVQRLLRGVQSKRLQKAMEESMAAIRQLPKDEQREILQAFATRMGEPSYEEWMYKLAMRSLDHAAKKSGETEEIRGMRRQLDEGRRLGRERDQS
jgi:hypothetical protein